MSRTIYNTATTLNGFLADDEHSLDWLFAVPGADEANEAFGGFLAEIGVLVMGSSTYEWIVRHEDLMTHPEKWRAFYGDRAAWVFTSRELPEVPGSGIRFASGDVRDAWPDIVAAAGDRDVWIVGGGELVAQFADAGLIDELRISIAPATLVSGKPLLPRSIGADRLHLESVGRSGQFAELVYSLTS